MFAKNGCYFAICFIMMGFHYQGTNDQPNLYPDDHSDPNSKLSRTFFDKASKTETLDLCQR